MPLKLNTASSGSVTLTPENTASNLTITVPAQTGSLVTADASGNVGIGTSSPASGVKLDVNGKTKSTSLDIGTTAGQTLDLFKIGSSNYIWCADAAPILFGNNNAERVRLDTSGNWLVGTTTLPFAGTANTIVSASSGVHQFQLRNTASAAGRAWRICADTNSTFYILNQDVAGVSISNGATSWSSVSDERLKTDLQPITNASEKVASLRAVTGRYITDEEGKSRSFLIAQDVEAVLPEAVTKSKLINDDNDDTEYLNVSYTDTIPLLVAAIQELKAEVDSLKSEVIALKGQA